MPTNEYYDSSGVPSTGSSVSSNTIRSEFDSIEAGFMKLPTLSGNGGLPVFVNSGGSTLETKSIAATQTAIGLASPTGNANKPVFINAAATGQEAKSIATAQTLLGIVPNALDAGSTGKKIRVLGVEIYDGAAAASIACACSGLLNCSNIALGQSIEKGETVGAYELDPTGYSVIIDASASIGTGTYSIVAPSGSAIPAIVLSSLFNNTNLALQVQPASVSSGVITLNFTTVAGVPVDITTMASSGYMSLTLVVFTTT